MPGSHAQPRRYRRDGQSQSPQGRRRQGSDRGRRRRFAISARVLARSQSDRDVLQQTQGVSAQSRRADTAEPAPPNRSFRASPRRRRMRELLRSCRICFNMNGIRSSSDVRDLYGMTEQTLAYRSSPDMADDSDFSATPTRPWEAHDERLPSGNSISNEAVHREAN